MLQFIQLPKIYFKKLCDKAIMKKLNLNICVYPAHCYRHPISSPCSNPLLQHWWYFSSSVRLIISIFLQTLHLVRSPRLPARVQLAQFICVTNEPALVVLSGLPGLLLPCRGEENPAEEWSKASISGRQMLSKHRKETPVAVSSHLRFLPSLFWSLLAGINENPCNIHLIPSVY